MNTNIPDISKDSQSQYQLPLDKVGMQNIELPILIKNAKGSLYQASAKIDIFINLCNPKAKGIHMSRLFLLTQDILTSRELSDKTLQNLLEQCIQTHKDLASSAYVNIKFDLFLQRKALLSDNKGWKAYPVTVSYALENDELIREFSVKTTYSSTCPCSAALARQDVQNNFLAQNKDTFSKEEVFQWLGKENSISATAHAQRSEAFIKVKNPKTHLDFIYLIDLIDKTLKTPTQAVVKREDEQEFARLNAQNLMFCEDSAKKLKNALNTDGFAQDFFIKVEHFESLHPHDAVAITTKNVPNGYQA